MNLLGLARTVTGTAVSAPFRVLRLLDDAEALVARVDALVRRIDGIAAASERVVAVAARAAERADETSALAQRLMQAYAPIAERGRPYAKQFVDELSEAEVHAAIKLVDLLPTLSTYMHDDVVPILATMDKVGPDIHSLLEVAEDVRHAVKGIPGFRFFERRGADREAEEDLLAAEDD